jgi:hypothetical protein
MKPLNKAELIGIIAGVLLVAATILYNPDPLAVRHAKEASHGETAKPENHGK